MKIGKTQNNFTLTKEMVERSLDTFKYTPIVWNERESFKDYRDIGDELTEYYKQNKVIGFICSDACIKADNVHADIIMLDKYVSLWKGEYDNWRISLAESKESFVLENIEVF